MKFKDFINTLTQQEVDELWEHTADVPEDAIEKNWKYSLRRGDKFIPVKWFVSQLAMMKGEQIDFQSNYDNRDVFAQKFGFTIHEDLVFDKQDFNRFKKFYDSQVKNKSLFQFFVGHCHNVLASIPIDPYKIRMAITQENEAMMIVGMRSALSYKNDRIGFIINKSDSDEINELYNLEKNYEFGGANDVFFFYSHPNFVPDITVDKLLDVNANTIKSEYKKIESSKIARWNAEAATTNDTLKKIMFENRNVEEFIKINKEHNMEYFDLDGLRMYKDLSIEKYDSQSDATKIFNDTRSKIQYLSELLSQRLGIKLHNNYNEKVNKQAGKGKGYHNHKTYILKGFIPNHLKNIGKDIFIKISFILEESQPIFHYQLDINYKDDENPYKSERDYLLNLNPLWINVDEKFPKSWEELLNGTVDNFKKLIDSLESFLKTDNDHLQENPEAPVQMNINYPLNQILFGCPGSGKTYSTKKLAVEIIEGRQFSKTKEDREEILKLYDRYYELKQIRFTTFHQSLGYEDFIEGIKPKTIDHKVIYEVEDGIFTKIASKAQDNWLNSQSSRQSNILFEDALTKLKDDWEEDNSIQFPLKTKGSDFTIISFNEKNLRFRKASGGTAHTLSFKTMKELFYEERKHTNHGVGIYYPSIIDKLNSYSDDTITTKTLDRYVLIMDEINRGNISSIFGELITLIEDDKRLGRKESIEVILPYSKENFGVPPNLYLIGTMNTADRSVEALDTALRRRFSFTEMKSDPQVLLSAHENGGTIPETNINLISLLETINKRIELLVDKDHQIGHSYFISVNTLPDLRYTFKNKIIPLLEEYFYGDFGKIGLVLGDRFVSASAAHENKKILANFKGYDDVDFLTDKKIYEFSDIDSMNSSDFISIYQSVSVSANNES